MIQRSSLQTPLSQTAAHLWLGAEKPNYGKILLDHDFGGWRDLGSQAREEAWASLVDFFKSAAVLGVADDWLDALGRHHENEGLGHAKCRLAFALAMAGADPARFGDADRWESLEALSQQFDSFALPADAMEHCRSTLVKAQLSSVLEGPEVCLPAKKPSRL